MNKYNIAGESFWRARCCHPFQDARKMERNAVRVLKKLRQEELQYFRSFLHRMGGQDRFELLETIPIARLRCSFILGCDKADLHPALDGFVSKRGPIVYPDFLIGNDVPSDEQRESYLSDFKTMLEMTNNLRFKYTPLDRFIQFLFENQHFLQDYILMDNAAINDDEVAEFFLNCSKMRSGLLTPVWLRNMNIMLNAFIGLGYYKTAVAEARADNSELASSGSEDTAESQGDQNANPVIENA